MALQFWYKNKLNSNHINKHWSIKSIRTKKQKIIILNYKGKKKIIHIKKKIKII